MKSTQWLYGAIFLKELHIGNCKTLTTLIEGIEQNNKHIEELRIEGCHDPVPFVFKGHPPASLKKLDVRNCGKLQCLFDDNEDISSCSSSSVINKEDGNISTCHLQDLFVQDCPSLTCVLSSIHQLSATLVHLSIKKCSKLTNLLLPTVVKYLEIEECSELITLRDQLPEKLGSLKISWCPKLESIVERFHNNTDLYEIWVVGCEKLKSIPDGLYILSSLSDIRISYCANLVSFPEGGFPDTNLRVEIKACEKLKALPQVHTLTSLQQLSLWDCPSLSFPAQGLPTNLESLAIQGHKLYVTLEEVHTLTSLRNLSICGLPDILSFRVEEIPISLPPNLTQLYIGHFPNLKDLSSMGLEKLTSLKCLCLLPEFTTTPQASQSQLFSGWGHSTNAKDVMLAYVGMDILEHFKLSRLANMQFRVWHPPSKCSVLISCDVNLKFVTMIDIRIFYESNSPLLSLFSHHFRGLSCFEILNCLLWKVQREDLAFVCMMLWAIWLNRNALIHKQKVRHSGEILDWVVSYLEDFQNTQSSLKCLPKDIQGSRAAVWLPPPVGSFSDKF
ncbi:hypothetical protein EZV62_008369 [Acer yangbiense]|uniref:Disease resistance protein At4g27190-like leucine-rich repeats domain-containing protein n=1 Tax=Acer yangbiense TaxID=1000413 RepID=A0A5C7IDG1_9ROSI|nr:hypothetical protein EZV62_008369 [Acer yangbiense]